MDSSDEQKHQQETGISRSCRFCSAPHKKDELTGVYYCPHCENILSHLPQGRTYMLLGKSGVGKSILLYKLIDLYLRNKMPCIYIAYDEYPAQIRISMRNFIRDLDASEDGGLLNFVDCYSGLGGVKSQEKISIGLPGDVNDLNLKITDLISGPLAEGSVKVFLDSATSMFIHCPTDTVLKFLMILSAKVKSRKGSFFFTLGEGAVSEEVQKRLEQIADGLIEFKMSEAAGRTKRYYRISKVRGAMYFDSWLPFFIGKENIFLAPPEEPEEEAMFMKLFQLIMAEG